MCNFRVKFVHATSSGSQEASPPPISADFGITRCNTCKDRLVHMYESAYERHILTYHRFLKGTSVSAELPSIPHLREISTYLPSSRFKHIDFPLSHSVSTALALLFCTSANQLVSRSALASSNILIIDSI